MISMVCGSVIGIVMGLTGAGGALVAIPLFMQFFGMDLKEASVYSLVAVVLASLLNYVDQRRHTRYRTAIMIVAMSALASYLTAPFKEILSPLVVALLLTVVSLYGLYSVWSPVSVRVSSPSETQGNLVLSVALGFILGTLTTFTGLGGGVLMLPLLLKLYRYTQPQAVATSLFAVGLSSLASLIVQVMHGASFRVDLGFVLLLAGILVAVFALKQVVKHLGDSRVVKLRQLVFTGVVILAVLKIF